MLALMTAATGMSAAETQVDVIANNLANQNSTAFKRRRASFSDLIYQNKVTVGAQTSDTGTIRPVGVQVGLGVNTGAVYMLPEQGTLSKTDGRFDIALNGKGYFRVTLPDGSEVYTRDGSFKTNADGEIVTKDGFTVSPGISVPATTEEISINASGEVLAKIAGATELQNLGQFVVVNFINEMGLESRGNNYMSETPASGNPIDGIAGQEGLGELLQGWLEGSNVNPVTELTDLIKAQRAFEFNTKIVQKTDENMRSLTQIVG
jgi:flagellar basal-body rod protein FlgG